MLRQKKISAQLKRIRTNKIKNKKINKIKKIEKKNNGEEEKNAKSNKTYTMHAT